jgi:hypothetical protein
MAPRVGMGHLQPVLAVFLEKRNDVFPSGQTELLRNRHSNLDNRKWKVSEIVIWVCLGPHKHCCVVKKKTNFSEKLTTLLYFACLRLHTETADS